MSTPKATTIVVKNGECVILPSNAVIVSAYTLGIDPAVDSADCPQLAD